MVNQYQAPYYQFFFSVLFVQYLIYAIFYILQAKNKDLLLEQYGISNEFIEEISSNSSIDDEGTESLKDDENAEKS